jgi:hypothetical protein
VRITTGILSVAPCVAVGALLLAERQNLYWLGASWGLAMLLSLHGWGLLVESLVRPRKPIDVGLSFSWGLAATFVVGGVACALHAATRPFLVGQVLVGSLLSLGFRAARWRPAPSRRRLFCAIARPLPYFFALGAMVLPAINYLGLLGDYKFNLADDQSLYILEAEKIVQTGSPFDPFNSRRVALYGGVDYLNAQFIAVGKYYQLHVVDGGVGMLMIFALVVGALGRRGMRRTNLAFLAIPLLLFATMGDVRINIGSLATGAAAFIGVYRTFVWLNDDPASGRNMAFRRLALLGACIMTCVVLRPTNAIPAAAFVTLALARRRLLERPRAAASAAWLSLREAIFVGLSCLALLAPWLVVFHESVGSFAYPFALGNATPGFVLVKTEPGLGYNLKHSIADFLFAAPIRTSLLLLAAGVLPLGWTAARSKQPTDYVPLLTVVCFVGMCFTSYMSGACEDWVNSRYLYGFMVGTIFVITTSVVPRGAALNAPSPRALLAATAVVAHAAEIRDTLKTTALARIDMFDGSRKKWAADDRGDQGNSKPYLDVQAHVPEHQAVAVIVNEPCRFDLRRNPVYSLDNSPGGLGPKPGFPIFKGPNVLADYFLHNGVRYLIAGNLHDQVNVDSWRGHLKDEHSYLGYEAPIVVDAFESIEKIVQTRHVVYEGSGMKVIDLRGAPEG